MWHRAFIFCATGALVLQLVNFSSSSPIPLEPQILYISPDSEEAYNDRYEVIGFKALANGQKEIFFEGSYTIDFPEYGKELYVTYTADSNGYKVHYSYEPAEGKWAPAEGKEAPADGKGAPPTTSRPVFKSFDDGIPTHSISPTGLKSSVG